MKRQSLRVFFVLCLLWFCIPAMAQKFEDVRERADKFVRTKRPDLKLERKTEKGKEAVYNWGTARDGVEVVFFQGKSRQEAIERMRATLKFLPAGPGKKRTDLGDEAYSWQSPNSDLMGFRFRKGNVFIELVASKDIAEDLARDLFQLVSNK